ncbi:MAG: ATP-grasp domain-containing protein [Bacteroidota bacterium]|jgi:D-alanine-D-alanine ligase
MKNKRVVFLYNRMSENPKEDELDVVRQMKFIKKSLNVLGYESFEVPFDIHLQEVIAELKNIKPLVVFNLVEMMEGTGALLHISPSILNVLDIPYTGVQLEAMFITTSKVLCKQQMRLLGLPTSDWYTLDQIGKLKKDEMYIVKPIWEDGSLGLDEENIFQGNNKEYIRKLKKLNPKKFFIEQYIDGREFNLSVLGGKKGPEVMPPAEILFKDYPEGKHRIVGYKAKWTEDSFEYNHTPRTFRYKKEDLALVEELKVIAINCWNAFGLKGYVRVDFRVDKNLKPYILEVNGNPCIAPESGYVAATKQAGLTFPQVVERIIEDALN